MDAGQFDGLLGKLASPATRRLTLGALVSVGLAALLGQEEEIEAKKGGKKGGGKRGGGKKGGGKGKGKKHKKNNPPPPPPEGIGECINFGLHSGCRNVAGKPWCDNGVCQPCSTQDDTSCPDGQTCSANSNGVNSCIINPF